MSQLSLYVAGAYVPIDVSCEWPMPGVQRVGTTQFTPYGPAWDDGTDEQGQAEQRARPSTVILRVGGANVQAAADRAELWTQRMLTATRLRHDVTGRFLELLLVRSVQPRDPVRGTFYTLTFEVEYLNPYWHETTGDGSSRLHP